MIQFDSVPLTSPFKKLVHNLEKWSLTRLAKRVKHWFNETSGAGIDFQYRFTGQDSKLFLKNFMHLIDALEKSSDSTHQTFLLHVFAYTRIQLRQSASLFSAECTIGLSFFPFLSIEGFSLTAESLKFLIVYSQ